MHPVARAAALACALAACAAHSQTTLPPVTVTDAPPTPGGDLTGFGRMPLQELPAAAGVVTRRQIETAGARRLADLTQFDASVTDAYNAAGYWDFVSIRGFTLDNRFNYRREGLPINAETTIPLDNKERVEILHGTSGLQAGTSAPGGLVNYVVKRPTEEDVRDVRLQWTQRASLLGAVDLGGRFGADRAFGWRLNVSAEQLRPRIRDLDGERSLLALATDWRLSRDSRFDAEFEWSRQSQPSQAGFSLLGSRLPAVPDPRLNLNNQPWSLPVVMEGLTGTLRYEQRLGEGWRFTAKAGSQRLRSDDRIAFAFGCSAENNFDRYCSDGTYDLYDFRSENERRRQDAAQVQLQGSATALGARHDLTIGLLASRVRNRFQPEAFNFVGTGNVQGTSFTPADPSLTDENTNRNERSTELSLADAIRWTDRFSTWIGVRTTRLARDSVRTDGSRATSYSQGLSTPWVAVSYRIRGDLTAYASWGEGLESQVVPNRPSQYTNAGQALPALRSKQAEAGLKGGTDPLTWQLAAFRIARPVSNLDACSRLGITPCQGAYDGEAVHRGIEANAQWADGPWRLAGGATWLRARREGSVLEPATNGVRPTNIPAFVLRAQAGWRVPTVPGLEASAQLSHEGGRSVVPDGSIELPAWTRVDASVRYATRLGGTATTWAFGVDNLFDRRYWRESPYQFGHVYLYPGAPRTVRLSVTASL